MAITIMAITFAKTMVFSGLYSFSGVIPSEPRAKLSIRNIQDKSQNFACFVFYKR